MLTMLGWGLLSDRVGERLVSVVGLGGAAAALVGAARAPSAVVLSVLLVVAGASGASVNAATGRAVMTWFGPHERGLALGIRQTAVPIGGGLAALVLPLLDHAFGLGAALGALAAGCAGAALAALVGLRRPPRTDDAPVEAAALVHPLRDSRIWWLSVGSTLLTCAQASIVAFTVLFLHVARGFSTGQAAAVLAAIQVLSVAGRIYAGRWSDRRASRLLPLRRLTALLVVGMVAVSALADAPAAVLVPVLILAGAVATSWNALSFTAVAELAGHARSGAALGFQQTGIVLANSVTPIAFAAIVAASSWQIGYAAIVVCPVAALYVFSVLVERPRAGALDAA